MRVVLSSLLLALALLGCEQNWGASSSQDEVDSLQTLNETLRGELQRLRDSLRVRQGNEQEGTTLTPPIYFPSGSAWIPDRGRRQLDQHAETIKERYADRSFRIKGYTDSVPIGPSLKDTYPSNWYLSAQRAAAVAHYLNEEHQIRTQTLEIEAFAPTPAAANETTEDRRENRRVEIVVVGGGEIAAN